LAFAVVDFKLETTTMPVQKDEVRVSQHISTEEMLLELGTRQL